MPIYDLYSKRQKRARGEVPDVYTYDWFPEQLRIQITYIIDNAIGVRLNTLNDYREQIYETINGILCEEYGVFSLVKTSTYLDFRERLFKFFLETNDVGQVLDFIELTFRAIDTVMPEYQDEMVAKIQPDQAIKDLNSRFKEHGIGYQYESGEIIRVDSLFIHSEVVKPVLAILREENYQGANDEFLKAHEHYRHGRLKECIVEACKAFESTMKTICKKHSWGGESATASQLIDICSEKSLFPAYLKSQLSGTPSIRNKVGGHGQGAEVVNVSESLARYALNLTASNILFLAECEKNLT